MDFPSLGRDSLEEGAQRRIVDLPLESAGGREGDDLLLDGVRDVRLRQPDPSEAFAGFGRQESSEDLGPLGLAAVCLGLLSLGVRVWSSSAGLHVLDLLEPALP
jgi:hypothetical protein